MTDALKRQVGGDHYNKEAIQPWHIIDSHNLDFYEGNAIKYILRRKGDRVEDLEKAIHYLERKIELLSEHEGQTKMELYEDTQYLVDEGILAPVSKPPIKGDILMNGKEVEHIFTGTVWRQTSSLEGRAILNDFMQDKYIREAMTLDNHEAGDH